MKAPRRNFLIGAAALMVSPVRATAREPELICGVDLASGPDQTALIYTSNPGHPDYTKISTDENFKE